MMFGPVRYKSQSLQGLYHNNVTFIQLNLRYIIKLV